MRLSTKMTTRFLAYFVVFYAVLLIVSIGLIVYFVYDVMNSNSYTDIRELDAFELESDFTKDSNGIYHLSQDLIDSAHENKGLVQLVNKNGKVLASSEKSSDCCNSYTISQFVAMTKTKEAFVWEQGNGLYIVFIEKHPATQLLSMIVQENGTELSNNIQKKLKEADASFEIYTPDGNRGKVVFGPSNPALSGIEILTSSHNYSERKEVIASEVLEDGNVAVVRVNNSNYNPFEPAFEDGMKKFGIGLLLFHLILFFFTILFSFWIGSRFGRPVLYFLKRIEKLAKQDYEVLDDRKLRNHKTGRLKRKYRVYEDIDQSLSHLAYTQEANERKIMQTEKLREDWITGLSHDLKTPLSSIYGYSTMLSSDNYAWSNEEVKSFAKIMQEKSTYMNALIEDLTYTYQLKNNAISIEKINVNLFEFVKAYSSKSVWKDIQDPIGDEGAQVYIDPKLFERVLDNLVGNAIKHTPEGTKVLLIIEQNKDNVLLTIQDEGKGIPIEELENLFNRYYRGTNTTTEVSGTGLGLAIAKQLVEAHNGDIQVESSEFGTIVTITLPSTT
ncbi:sensor histidine kinase [Psychrobacillus psychrodurans]|uniref:sensor histidine kinase n=1 Tax=Psychrobacillus psychrodurans TaxID=126157 RepID=UPI0008DFF706|nr:HAMP domain-containing sensor histidine kinase [Psychrobacillus psychrodurans]MCZ8540730.1 HAMP domain-containing histidine kinase [Psychrobacillus psychrodurans]SFM74195.1 His Kinase A (phospho-acceptor) domain-containing protein [Psychrobacillus psychrodurans]